jgi:dienelactone hydrolase
VVVIHGTMGIDSRIEFYRAAILKEGIATFEVDFKSGIYSSPLNRPHPSAFVPMVFAAHVAFYPAFKRLLHEKANFEVATVEYAGALHAFNRNAPPEDHWDPVAIGHRSHTAWNADAANDSLGQVVSFLHNTLHASQQ